MRFKVSYKIIAAVGAVTVVIIGVLAYLILKAQQRLLIAEVERSAHQLSETVKSSTRYEMLLNQRESVHRIISTISQQAGIEKVRIFNKEGKIINSSDAADIGRMVDKNAEACYACHTAGRTLEKLSIPQTTRIFQSTPQRRTLGVINPIYNEPSCWHSECHAHAPEQKVLGVLDITMSLADVDRGVKESRRRVPLFAVVAIAALSLVVYLVVDVIVLRPVGRIAAATRHVAAGDLGYTLDISKRDEIGDLASSFNTMTRQLSEAQRQLHQQDKLASVGRLAAGVAHEINNPLTGVLTYASFLLKRTTDRPEIKEDLEVIVRETMRCREIVKGLLDFARQSTPEKRPRDINEIIAKAARILQNQFSLHHVELEQKLQPNLPLVSADSSQIQQVLVNLFMNAVDAIGEKGGRITVSTSRTTDEYQHNGHTTSREYVQIDVADTGCGIPQQNLAKIFEPFFTTKGQKGNGLGLAMVWGIIEKHDGHISAKSTEGEGTTFTVLLPVEQGKT